MKFILKLFLFFFSLTVFSQATSTNTSNVYKTEDYILYNKLDSAGIFLKNIKVDSYKNVLIKLIKSEELTYHEYYEFTSKIGNRRSLNFQDVSNFINREVKKPEPSKKIDLDYFKIKWTQVFKFRSSIKNSERIRRLFK